MKSKKSALLLSFTSLLLCFAMLAGSTFAWFTDTATTGVNKIKAGNLDIELAYKNSTTGGEFEKANKETPVFDNNAQWEPGHVEYVVLKVSNEGNLALKYKLGINIANEVGSINVDNNAFKLSDYIRFAVLDGDKTEGSVDRDALVAAATDSKLIKEGYSKEDHLLAGENNSEKIVTLVVWMPGTVSNEANHKADAPAPSVALGINVVATQLNHENDSFGPDYDEDAGYPVLVSSTEDLTKALEDATPGSVVMLTDNVNIDKPLIVNKSMTLDLGANTVTNTANKGKDGIVISGNKENVVITATTGGIHQNNERCIKVTASNSDITVDGGTYSVAGTSNAYFMENSYSPSSNSNNVTIQNVTYNGERGVQFSNGNNNNITIKDSTFNTNVTGYSTIFIGGNNNVCTLENVTVNGAKIFAADSSHTGSDGYSVINIKSGTYDCQLNTSTGCTISITGGTFKNTGLTLDKFKTYVADGYAVTVNTDGSWTVAAK